MILILLSVFSYNANINGANTFVSGYKTSYYNLFSFLKEDKYVLRISLKNIKDSTGVDFFCFTRDSLYRDLRIGVGDFIPKTLLPFSSYPGLRGIKLNRKKNFSLYIGRVTNRQYSLFPGFSENRYLLLFDIKTKGIPAFKPSFSFSVRDNKIPERNKIVRMTGNFLFKPSEYWYIDNKTSFGILHNNGNQPFIGTNIIYRLQKQNFHWIGRGIFISPRYITPYSSLYSGGLADIHSIIGYQFPFGMAIGEGIALSSTAGRRNINFSGSISGKTTISYLPSIKFLGDFAIGGIPSNASISTSKGIEISGNMKFLYYNYYYLKSGKVKRQRTSFRLNLPSSPYYKVMFNVERSDSIFKQYYSLYVQPYKKISFKTGIFVTGTKVNGVNIKFNTLFPSRVKLRLGATFYEGYLSFSGGLNVSGGIEKFGFSTLEGRAFVDENGDKIFNSGESPWKDIDIILDEKDTIKTDNQGRYRFRFIPAGPHIVRVDFRNIPANYGQWHYSKKFTVNMWTKKYISFPLSPLGTITGKVYYDTNSNGIWDKGEKGVPNIIVSVKGAPSLSITNKDGIYKLCNFPPGAYIIGVRNLPRGYILNPPHLIIYAYLKPGAKKTNMSFGIIKKKRPIRKKVFK